MTALPDALRPWREWLSWFDPELAVQIGPLLQRLHPLLGAFRGQNQGGEPELEGLDDLRSRGSYEHLLASEWLLADEIPDEFLRRAASGEHVFLAPRPRARRADRSIVALFDAGPLQFGGPRLAHVALWILLARRAQQSQGEFRWGSLQSPGELFEASSSADLKTLLHRRTFTLTEETKLAAWRAVLEEKAVGGERWLIGPSLSRDELQAAPVFTHRISLQRDLRGTSLDVALHERGAERGVQLPLPEPTSAAPLLRGIFDRAAAPRQYTSDPRAVALSRPPVISIDGTRVALAMRDEPAALVFVVPRSAQDQPAVPRHQGWAHGCAALAMSFMGKRMGVLLADDRQLRFWGTKLAMTPYPPLEDFHAPRSIAAWLPLAWMKGEKAQKSPRVCMIDHSNRLLCWDSAGLRTIAHDVLGMAQINKAQSVYAFYSEGSVWTSTLQSTGDPTPPKQFCGVERDATVLFARRGFAVRQRKDPEELWSMGHWNFPGARMQVKLPAESRAIGLIRTTAHTWFGLITLDRNVLRLHLTDGSNEQLYAAPDRVVSWSVCPNTGLVAMLTERRQFIVVSALSREVCLSVQTARQSLASD